MLNCSAVSLSKTVRLDNAANTAPTPTEGSWNSSPKKITRQPDGIARSK